MGIIRAFSDFKIGDCAVFEQAFKLDEFELFAKLSGDRNLLHHDASHAAKSRFGQPIVPMHMTIAPLSRIAGMIFPGVSSLYLGHELRSIRPVYYGEKLRYNARIIAINTPMRILTIRVLVSRGMQVVLDAKMRVMAQQEGWEAAEDDGLSLSPPFGTALVTGATGEIGTALAMTLARRGWNLILVDRGAGLKRTALEKKLFPLLDKAQSVDVLSADLLSPDKLEDLCRALERRYDIEAVFHVASPPINADILDLVRVNYTALKRIASSVVPGMLMRQNGTVVAIGSVASERVIPGWDDYSAAKAMAGQFLTRFDKTYSEFGIRGLTVLSGLVATAYSASIQGESPAMLPQELAEAVAEAALDRNAGQAIIIEYNDRRAGVLGFHDPSFVRTISTGVPSGNTSEAKLEVSDPTIEGDLEPRINDVVRGKLKLAPTVDLKGGGVGVTPGWDSLRHIELVLELESEFGIHFKASEVEQMLTYDALVSTVRTHVVQH